MIGSNPFAKDGVKVSNVSINGIWSGVCDLLKGITDGTINDKNITYICNNLESTLGPVADISPSDFFELGENERNKIIVMQDLYDTVMSYGPNSKHARYSMIAWRLGFFLFLKETNLLSRLSEVLDTPDLNIETLLGHDNKLEFEKAVNALNLGVQPESSYNIKEYIKVYTMKFNYLHYLTNSATDCKLLSGLDLHKRDLHAKILKQRRRGLITLVEYVDRASDVFHPL